MEKKWEHSFICVPFGKNVIIIGKEQLKIALGGGKLFFRSRLFLKIRIKPKDNGLGDLKPLWIMSHCNCSQYEDTSHLLRAASKSHFLKYAGGVATLSLQGRTAMAYSAEERST